MKNAESTANKTREHEIDWSRLIEVALDSPGSVGDVYSRFHQYSYANQQLLRMQGVSEPVATYKRWQSLGRQVLRGSRAYTIVRPVIAKQVNSEGDEEAALVGFKPVNCLFTVSQTDGEPLPPVELRSWDLDTALDTLDIGRGRFELLDGNTQGYSWGREFAINPVAADPLRTTFHEIGHIVLGHTAAMPDYAMHRGEKEFQAEATAYLTLNELEQLTPEMASHSRGYVQHWLETDRPSDLAIRQVFSATDTILKAGRSPIEVSRTPDV